MENTLTGSGKISFKAYTLSAPQLSFERRPAAEGKEIVPWFDSDNLFPLHLSERAALSTTHNRILRDKVNYILGDGLMVDATARHKKLLHDYLSRCNAAGEDIQAVLSRIALDFCTYGNAFLYLVRNGDFTAISHLDATWCRVAAKKPGIYYSRGFNRRQDYLLDPELKPEFIPAYPQFAGIRGSKSQHAVLHIRDYAPGYHWYGQIDYHAAWYSGWLDIDYHIPKYNLSRFHNQFRPSGLLVVAGQNLNEQQAEALQQEISRNYVGEGTASKLLVAIVNDEAQAPKFIPFDDAAKGAFADLQQMANENIILAHNWHPALVIQQPGKLSGGADIRAAFEQVYHTVIRQKQHSLLRPLKRVLGDMGFVFNDLSISTPFPVGAIDPQKVLTTTELRQELGFEE
jgi:hypothetical protein